MYTSSTPSPFAMEAERHSNAIGQGPRSRPRRYSRLAPETYSLQLEDWYRLRVYAHRTRSTPNRNLPIGNRSLRKIELNFRSCIVYAEKIRYSAPLGGGRSSDIRRVRIHANVARIESYDPLGPAKIHSPISVVPKQRAEIKISTRQTIGLIEMPNPPVCGRQRRDPPVAAEHAGAADDHLVRGAAGLYFGQVSALGQNGFHGPDFAADWGADGPA